MHGQCHTSMQMMQFMQLQQPVTCIDDSGAAGWHFGGQQECHAQNQQQLVPWMASRQKEESAQSNQQTPGRKQQNSPRGGGPSRNRQKHGSNSSSSAGSGQRRESWRTSASTLPSRTSFGRASAQDRNGRPGTPPSKYSSSMEEPTPSEGDFRSLKHQLQAVNLEDPAAVITVREIKTLTWPGATVEERLEAYFSTFGSVKEVLVPRAAVKQVSANRKSPVKASRVRSSNVGWVVMSSADAVTDILRAPQHVVEGLPIRVEEFRRSNWGGGGKQADSLERSSSSDSSNSMTRASTEAMSPIDTSSPVMAAMATGPATSMAPTWLAAGGPQASPHHGSIALVPDSGVPAIACAVPIHWIPNGIPASPMMAAGAWALPETPTHMQAPFSQVFNASEEELRKAMPEIYDE